MISGDNFVIININYLLYSTIFPEYFEMIVKSVSFSDGLNIQFSGGENSAFSLIWSSCNANAVSFIVTISFVDVLELDNKSTLIIFFSSSALHHVLFVTGVNIGLSVNIQNGRIL